MTLLPNRASAGRQLAKRLLRLRETDPLILALPRGGVPVAYEIARALDAELDLMLVRKLGAPGNREFAIGAVVDGEDPQVVLNDDAAEILSPGSDYLTREMSRQLIELERRRTAYLGSRRKPRIAGRMVVMVDDGIATGATITAAIKGARKAGVAGLVLAVPVAPRDAVARLEPLCDEIIVIAMPEPFGSVGQHYADFTQTGDAEVVRLMRDARRARPLA